MTFLEGGRGHAQPLSRERLRLVLTAPLANLTLADLPQLVHLCSISGDRALHHACCSADGGTPGNGIRRSLGLDFDDSDTRVVLTAIVCAIAEVANPGLELLRVVFLDNIAITDHRSFAADRSPLACAVEEGDIDGRVGIEIVGLAGFGVGVEDEVDATGFLDNVSVRYMKVRLLSRARRVADFGVSRIEYGRRTYLSSNSHAS